MRDMRHTKDNAIAVGTQVIATDYRGVEIIGEVTERSWMFDDLMFYVVDEPRDPARPWERRDHHIWPERDAIRAV